MISNKKIKRFKYQIVCALMKNDKRGQSKHLAKSTAKKLNSSGLCPSIKGIYSSETLCTYSKQSLTAIKWIANKYGCKTLEECKPHLSDYYQNMINADLSAWTIRTRAYALSSVYNTDPKTLFNIESLPSRKRANIKRTRVQSKSDTRFVKPIHNDVRTLAMACGARRGGLLQLSPNDIFEKNGQLYIHLKEKGGKHRDALVLQEYKAAVVDIFNRYKVGTKVGDNTRLLPLTAFPAGLTLHKHRAEYAQKLYMYFYKQGVISGEIYHCRKDMKNHEFDKGTLMAVSKMLGHSRHDVVVSHYLNY